MASLGSGPLLLSVGLIAFFSITLFVRRWLASRRSGGSLFSLYHISNGIFYIHEPLCFSRRMIPLKEIKQITYLLLRGRAGGGSRYAFYIELRNGKTIPFFFGRSKRNEVLVEKLKRNAGKYGFKVHFQR